LDLSLGSVDMQVSSILDREFVCSSSLATTIVIYDKEGYLLDPASPVIADDDGYITDPQSLVIDDDNGYISDQWLDDQISRWHIVTVTNNAPDP
jgi:hypothetical protein